jgi:hypothetical protein
LFQDDIVKFMLPVDQQRCLILTASNSVYRGEWVEPRATVSTWLANSRYALITHMLQFSSIGCNCQHTNWQEAPLKWLATRFVARTRKIYSHAIAIVSTTFVPQQQQQAAFDALLIGRLIDCDLVVSARCTVINEESCLLGAVDRLGAASKSH